MTVKEGIQTTVTEGITFNLRRFGHGEWPRVCRYCRLIIGNLFVFHKHGYLGKSRYYHVACAAKVGLNIDAFRRKIHQQHWRPMKFFNLDKEKLQSLARSWDDAKRKRYFADLLYGK